MDHTEPRRRTVKETKKRMHRIDTFQTNAEDYRKLAKDNEEQANEQRSSAKEHKAKEEKAIATCKELEACIRVTQTQHDYEEVDGKKQKRFDGALKSFKEELKDTKKKAQKWRKAAQDCEKTAKRYDKKYTIYIEKSRQQERLVAKDQSKYEDAFFRGLYSTF